MIIINRAKTNHNFEKQNMMTKFDRRGSYDEFKCSLCGLSGKAYNLKEVFVSEKSAKKAHNCPKANTPIKIQITQCGAFGKLFKNLIPRSIHYVVPTPEGHDNSGGVWVMGVGEPVKVLFDEYEVVS